MDSPANFQNITGTIPRMSLSPAASERSEFLLVPDMASGHSSSPSCLSVPGSLGHSGSLTDFSRRTSSAMSSLFDMTNEADQLDRAIRGNNTGVVSRLLSIYYHRFSLKDPSVMSTTNSATLGPFRRASNLSMQSEMYECGVLAGGDSDYRRHSTQLHQFTWGHPTDSSDTRRSSCRSDDYMSVVFRNALHVAIQHSSIDVLRLMLSCGVDPNQPGVNFMTTDSRRSSSISDIILPRQRKDVRFQLASPRNKRGSLQDSSSDERSSRRRRHRHHSHSNTDTTISSPTSPHAYHPHHALSDNRDDSRRSQDDHRRSSTSGSSSTPKHKRFTRKQLSRHDAQNARGDTDPPDLQSRDLAALPDNATTITTTPPAHGEVLMTSSVNVTITRSSPEQTRPTRGPYLEVTPAPVPDITIDGYSTPSSPAVSMLNSLTDPIHPTTSIHITTPGHPDNESKQRSGEIHPQSSGVTTSPSRASVDPNPGAFPLLSTDKEAQGAKYFVFDEDTTKSDILSGEGATIDHLHTPLSSPPHTNQQSGDTHLDFAATYTANHVQTLPPLYLAVVERKADTVRLLLDYGALANVTDKHGCTPLHIAVSPDFQSWDCALTLIEYGAKIHAVNDDGISPCHYSADLQAEQAELLWQHTHNLDVAAERFLHRKNTAKCKGSVLNLFNPVELHGIASRIFQRRRPSVHREYHRSRRQSRSSFASLSSYVFGNSSTGGWSVPRVSLSPPPSHIEDIEMDVKSGLEEKVSLLCSKVSCRKLSYAHRKYQCRKNQRCR